MDSLQRINPHLDPQDMAILRDRATRFAALPGPRVGDWVQMADKSLRRFTPSVVSCFWRPLLILSRGSNLSSRTVRF